MREKGFGTQMNADVAQMNVPHEVQSIRACGSAPTKIHIALVYVHLRYICVHLRSKPFS